MFACAKGTAILHISKTAVTNYLYCNPNRKLKDRFHSIVVPLVKRINMTSRENKILLEVRNILLPKLISGGLRIPDAEKFLEEAGI